ncbi:MAG: GlsB/YeaQ/YmgE family stress response membrane protein [Thermonemataceae bacterium]
MLTWLYIIIVGAVVGWLAGQAVRGKGFGFFGNVIIGIIGSVLGRWIARYVNIGLGVGLIEDIFTGVFGAIVLLLIFNLIRRVF